MISHCCDVYGSFGGLLIGALLMALLQLQNCRDVYGGFGRFWLIRNWCRNWIRQIRNIWIALKFLPLFFTNIKQRIVFLVKINGIWFCLQFSDLLETIRQTNYKSIGKYENTVIYCLFEQETEVNLLACESLLEWRSILFFHIVLSPRLRKYKV